MTPEDLRQIIAYVEERVRLEGEGKIVFDQPDEAEMVAAGLDPSGVQRILAAPWWQEMVEEIVETPEFCDPGESSQQVLRYARDVVGEYVRKRFPL
jgi:hypothetical protein